MAHRDAKLAELERRTGLEASLTIGEAAALLRMAPRTVYNLIYAGSLVAHRAGARRGWRIAPSEVRRIQAGK